MDQIIAEVKNAGHGFRTNKGEIKILCYADDAVLISENEDELQRLLHRFYLSAKKYNMVISTEKTKSLVVSKDPIRCKLAINDIIIEQVMSFRYLGVEISSNQNREADNRAQVNKAARVSGCLKDIIWKNKYMNPTSKVKIYKTCVRPIMTYAAETTSETCRTKTNKRTAEMAILRNINGSTLRDRVRSSDIRKSLEIQDVVRWVRERRRAWNDHISRMDTSRIVKISKEGIPGTNRPPGRPPKRWMDSWTSTSQEAN
ncbi:uncharacterized protein LOC129619146 [Condylostylus longicornis]|uniref:uncharacterized protein LOC129619146 n=1 Tax=Condylostylus longicornis TaxID=2530218 RepID=UPI00244E3315|nr:uncharacterized protein LOC129619146 [Condylostylus longicornis]